MKITCDLYTKTLTVTDPNKLFQCPITNTVRNIKNGWRKRNEIVYATTGDRSQNNTYPINPDKFPKGKWKITGIFHIDRKNYKTDQEFEEALRLFGPTVITTNAYRDTHVWALKSGLYDTATSKVIRDSQFWIHASDYKTSWGCILNPSWILQANLAEICRKELAANGEIPFTVI